MELSQGKCFPFPPPKSLALSRYGRRERRKENYVQWFFKSNSDDKSLIWRGKSRDCLTSASFMRERNLWEIQTFAILANTWRREKHFLELGEIKKKQESFWDDENFSEDSRRRRVRKVGKIIGYKEDLVLSRNKSLFAIKRYCFLAGDSPPLHPPKKNSMKRYDAPSPLALGSARHFPAVLLKIHCR